MFYGYILDCDYTIIFTISLLAAIILIAIRVVALFVFQCMY